MASATENGKADLVEAIEKRRWDNTWIYLIELKYLDVHKDNRIVCDASHNGLVAVLEQLGP